MTNLGVMYRDALGVPRNYDEARKWFEKAAERNDSDGILNLGHLIENGRGAPKNLKKACELYQRSADLGNGIAARNVKLVCKPS
jgi:TPR repeat protein